MYQQAVFSGLPVKKRRTKGKRNLLQEKLEKNQPFPDGLDHGDISNLTEEVSTASTRPTPWLKNFLCYDKKDRAMRL